MWVDPNLKKKLNSIRIYVSEIRGGAYRVLMNIFKGFRFFMLSIYNVFVKLLRIVFKSLG